MELFNGVAHPTLCRRIREQHLFPILMLTARGEDLDKITGLTLGAVAHPLFFASKSSLLNGKNI